MSKPTFQVFENRVALIHEPGGRYVVYRGGREVKAGHVPEDGVLEILHDVGAPRLVIVFPDQERTVEFGSCRVR